MDREQLVQSLKDVRTQQHLLDIKEETLQTMQSIAVEAMRADDSRRKVLDCSFQELNQQLIAIELKIKDSFIND
ncbi:hypothetical protein M3591_04280 [Exiguobacterium sp. MER 193]|uniref:hypothetical protein n=1 Tax=Exiguobacterium sp. MER 193 TaxID=2939564 RepID=UPI00203AE321|nr:hypothetical protein [Exiguobacterium sp. MER 193]MCM3279751.1 hypothetical protein [Exiguobacterium sp. MER 193]